MQKKIFLMPIYKKILIIFTTPKLDAIMRPSKIDFRFLFYTPKNRQSKKKNIFYVAS